MTNKKKAPARPGGDSPARTRTQRSLEERLADEKRKVAELEIRVAQERLDNALERGLVDHDDQPEFKLLKSEIAIIRKAEKAVQRMVDEDADEGAENLDLLKSLAEFRDGLVASMTHLAQLDGDDGE